MKRRAFVLGLGAALSGAAGRDGALTNARALSGGRFTASGEEFLLADIVAPPLYALNEKTPPFFSEAKRALQALLDAGASHVVDVAPQTRWGGRVVAAHGQNGDTLQEALARTGAVRIAPQTDDLAFIDRLLSLEAAARSERRGLWALSAYGVYTAEAAEGAVGAFHLIEGTVLRAVAARGRFYLNFGPDYRTDFTGGARSALYRKWARDGFDLAALEGARVRIRGFVERINGPSVDIRHVRQIETLKN